MLWQPHQSPDHPLRLSMYFDVLNFFSVLYLIFLVKALSIFVIHEDHAHHLVPKCCFL
jgi:hypothetical protein